MLVAQVICQPIAEFAIVLPMSAAVYASPATEAVALNPPATELLTRSEATRPASCQRDVTCVARRRQASGKSILPPKVEF
jgi:hypothetical protein